MRCAARQAIEIGLRRRVEMGAADHDDQLACGRARVWIGCGVEMTSAGNVSRSAPRPTMPRQIKPKAGAAMTPRIGAPSDDQRDIDGVFVTAGNEVAGAVERINQKIAALSYAGLSRASACSSEMTGRSGASRARPSRITASAAWSAAVTGEPSALMRTLALAGDAARSQPPRPR